MNFKKKFGNDSDLETRYCETHIYGLKKIKEKFKDDNFIISSKKGYFQIEKKNKIAEFIYKKYKFE